MLNVLSIDWDYFVEADAVYRGTYFPDIPNEKYSESLQNHIWASRYAEHPGLGNIGISPLASRFATQMSSVPYICVCDSHKWAYPLIVRTLRERGEKRVNLLNVDFHHDCRKDIKELDCGNWLSILMNDCKGRYRWFGRKDSYRTGKPKHLEALTDYASCHITDTAWDILFICRSDMWSPPHLDDRFAQAFKPLTANKDGLVQQGIWKSRYNDAMRENIGYIKSVHEKFKKEKTR